MQFMARTDALALDESLDAGDVSRALLRIWDGMIRGGVSL